MRLATILRRPASARHLVVQLAAAAVLLAGCGGGGSAGPSSGGTGAGPSSFAAGPITGFGSIIVNGVRYDDSSALVLDDDGNRSSREALKLGMGVEVHGGGTSDDGKGPRADAREIRHGAEILGPVSVVDASARTLVVLGQTVRVLDTTVIDERLVGGLAAITVGAVLEVHGTLDAASNVYIATRLQPSTAAQGFRIRGIVANLDAVARTFAIGGAMISYAGIAPVPAALANGSRVKVRLQTTPVGGLWIATRLDDGSQRPDDANEVELKGTITALTSLTSFSVNGIPVDASNAVFKEGSAALALGVQVEVKGSAVNGVVVATRVAVEREGKHDTQELELHGTITAIDTAAKTLVLREVTVSYAGPGIEYRDGTEAQLAVGVKIEVKGEVSTDGTKVSARRISFGD
ncbi:MAG: DUF5666 domain-containing protein [Caldimonas sp.]